MLQLLAVQDLLILMVFEVSGFRALGLGPRLFKLGWGLLRFGVWGLEFSGLGFGLGFGVLFVFYFGEGG